MICVLLIFSRTNLLWTFALFLAKFWKHDEVTGKLQNKAYSWMYGDVSWNIPKEGEEGFIEDRSDNSLGVMTVMPIKKNPDPSIGAVQDTVICDACYKQAANTDDTPPDTPNDTPDQTVDDVPVIEVKLKDDSLSREQSWLRTFITDDGFFTLENPASGAVLTACHYPEYRECEMEGLHWVSKY